MIRAGSEPNEHSAVQAKCRELIADAFLGAGRDRLDGLAQLLERGPLVAAQCRQVLVDGLGIRHGLGLRTCAGLGLCLRTGLHRGAGADIALGAGLRLGLGLGFGFGFACALRWHYSPPSRGLAARVYSTADMMRRLIRLSLLAFLTGLPVAGIAPSGIAQTWAAPSPCVPAVRGLVDAFRTHQVVA